MQQVPKIKLNKETIEALRTLIRHALHDIEYGPGGSYVKNAGSKNPGVCEGEVKRAKKAIQFIASLIENRIV
jgi:hypothetical protein